MNLNGLLLKKRAEILKKWFDLIIETYPAETANFLKSQKNQFGNPVGHAILEGIEEIFDGLLGAPDTEKAAAYLDNIIRIRAVQDFSPSNALSFLFLLKRVIRAEIANDAREYSLLKELAAVESRIDELVNISFDIYMRCREKLYELKANEMRNWTYRLLKNTDMVKEFQAEN
jgi:hypothetical protein